MKFTLATVALALFPTLGWSCASYHFCVCTNNGGGYHEAATKSTCPRMHGELQNINGRQTCVARVASAGIAGAIPLSLGNCRFRQICQEYGATGDSNCSGKF